MCVCVCVYRVIHKSLRDFRPLLYSRLDGHAEGKHVNKGRDTPSFCPNLQVLDMSTLAPSQLTLFWQIPRQNAFLLPVHAMFRHDCPLAVKPATTPRCLVHKKTWRDSLPIDKLLSAVSLLVVARPSSEVPEGRMNYPVYTARTELHFMLLVYTRVYQCKMMERKYVILTLTVLRYIALSLNSNTDSISYVETDHN